MEYDGSTAVLAVSLIPESARRTSERGNVTEALVDWTEAYVNGKRKLVKLCILDAPEAPKEEPAPAPKLAAPVAGKVETIDLASIQAQLASLTAALAGLAAAKPNGHAKPARVKA